MKKSILILGSFATVSMASIIIVPSVIASSSNTEKNKIINNALAEINEKSLLKPLVNISNILPTNILASNLDNYFQTPQTTQEGVTFSLTLGTADNNNGVLNLIVTGTLNSISIQKQILIIGFQTINGIRNIINNALAGIDANSLLKPLVNISSILPTNVSDSNLNNYFQVPSTTQNGVSFSLTLGTTDNNNGILNLIVSGTLNSISIQKQVPIPGFQTINGIANIINTLANSSLSSDIQNSSNQFLNLFFNNNNSTENTRSLFAPKYWIPSLGNQNPSLLNTAFSNNLNKENGNLNINFISQNSFTLFGNPPAPNAGARFVVKDGGVQLKNFNNVLVLTSQTIGAQGLVWSAPTGNQSAGNDNGSIFSTSNNNSLNKYNWIVYVNNDGNVFLYSWYLNSQNPNGIALGGQVDLVDNLNPNQQIQTVGPGDITNSLARSFNGIWFKI